MGRVDNKIVLITGAARGQGRSHAVRLASEGADIIAVDICADIESNHYAMATREDLDETARLVKDLGRRIVTQEADVRDAAALKRAVDAGVAELGGLHAVVAQAGICPMGNPDIQAFLDAVNVDLVGVVNAVTAAFPHLPDGASIVATGSLAALISGTVDNPQNGPGGIGYGWAKRSVASFVHDLATVGAARRIRANGVHPTNCNTDMLQSQPMYDVFRPDLEHPTRADAELSFPAINLFPGVGYVEPSDVSEAVLFLVSDESRYVTGMQLRIDAGAYLKAFPGTPAT